MDKWDIDNILMEKFFEDRKETDKIMLKLQDWSDFHKIPQKDLAGADDEAWEMFSKIVKMIKKFNKKNRRKNNECKSTFM